MKIGMVTDSLGTLGFDEVLDAAASLGLDCVEFATGNWSTAPHIDIDVLLRSKKARDAFTGGVAERGLTISALTCNGNSLHPGRSGKEHDKVIRKTIELAPMIGVDRVVLMSGCPGAKGDKHPNWITVAWPPETTEILEYQWNEVLIPYWRELVGFARKKGIRHLCLELHGGQNVYNVATLMRLRAACGAAVGVNFDPSHLMWMGADPIAAIEALGPAIFHVHAKDTRIDPRNVALNSRLETRPSVQARERSWNYVTLGYGQRRGFLARLLPGAPARRLRRRPVDRARGHGALADGGDAEVGRTPEARRHRRAGKLRAAEDLSTTQQTFCRRDALSDLRIGLIGSGFMGQAHADAFRRAALLYPKLPARPVLAMLADRDEPTAAAAAARFGFAEIDRRLAALVDGPRHRRRRHHLAEQPAP